MQQPSTTLYLQKLNDKIKKKSLKASLYFLFSQFGDILDIVALKTERMRGQAWIVFNDIGSSTNALRTLQGFPFYDSFIKISYAKTISKYFPLLEPVSNAIVRETKEPESDTESSASEMETDEPIVKKSKILLVKNLPDDVEVDMIQILFQQYSGFVEARMVPNKKGVAFVEFGLVDEANIARNVLDGFSVNATMRMSVEFFHE